MWIFVLNINVFVSILPGNIELFPALQHFESTRTQKGAGSGLKKSSIEQEGKGFLK